ncbi:hypothetical protein [Burkholderia ambifaria]|uniref:Uncharacterized protein n=1 Tax=Burkholderia ambifaria MEX-5 TaxID=396597 RepID=B1T3D2_9BURK|nr:hypothetical protein [Burkholderia ambifaria]EDT41902.1 hypothetical protein BamMEX5DRAFT_2298 [Burkholderia ambifaria MEX-5]
MKMLSKTDLMNRTFSDRLPRPFTNAIETILLDRQHRHGKLLNIIASIVHPNTCCHLFTLQILDDEEKDIVRHCLDYAISVGLTPEETLAIHRFLQPRIARHALADFGPSHSHDAF